MGCGKGYLNILFSQRLSEQKNSRQTEIVIMVETSPCGVFIVLKDSMIAALVHVTTVSYDDKSLKVYCLP